MKTKEKIAEYNKLYYLKNKIQIIKNAKVYRVANTGKISKHKQRYYNENKELVLDRNRSYVKNNKEKVLSYYRKYYREKMGSDIKFRITKSLRSRIYNALNRGTKSGTTLQLLGCTADQLKQYMEKQFKSGMSWNNYGEWHIDHIIPCARFDLTKRAQQVECFHHSNLQPLWASENIVKGDK